VVDGEDLTSLRVGIEGEWFDLATFLGLVALVYDLRGQLWVHVLLPDPPLVRRSAKSIA